MQPVRTLICYLFNIKKCPNIQKLSLNYQCHLTIHPNEFGQDLIAEKVKISHAFDLNLLKAILHQIPTFINLNSEKKFFW